MEQLELTALQKAKKKYYEKVKNDPTYIQHRRANCAKYYNKIKNETEFKEKVSNYKRQYYIQKKEQLLEIIV
jgi:hypothetical protein